MWFDPVFKSNAYNRASCIIGAHWCEQRFCVVYSGIIIIKKKLKKIIYEITRYYYDEVNNKIQPLFTTLNIIVN